MNLAHVFVSKARRWPDHKAVVSPRLDLSYRQLVARATRSACELQARGAQPGSNVGLAVRDSGEGISLLISLWMIGAVPVPIDFRTRAGERAALAAEFDLVAIIEDRQARELVNYASIVVDDSWTDIIARHHDAPCFDGAVSVPALISLTSGTTARALGIVLEHGQLLFRLETNLQLGRHRSGGLLLNPIPVSSSGSRNDTLSKLFSGATVFFHPPLFAADELADAILSKNATATCIVPTILRGLLELPRGRSMPLFPNLEQLYSFGAPLRPEEKRRARSDLCEGFVEGYSSTISGRVSALYGSDVHEHSETVGRILPHVELQIVDQHDRPLPARAEGTIRVRSPGMATKTFRSSSRVDGDRMKEGWVYPGDVGVVDEAGFLRILARASEVIIRGGTNVHPSEVEAAIAKHRGVKEVAVVGFERSREGEEIAAFVVPSDNLSDAVLVAHCRSHLSPDKRPRRFVFVNELPRNANGKVIRAELLRRLKSAS